MYQKKLETDIRCPLEYTLSVLLGKWRSRVLCALGYGGTMRFGELKAELLGVSDGVLAATVNDLIAAELVARQDVGYALTERGTSLLPLMRELCLWGTAFYDQSASIRMCQECPVCLRQSSVKTD